MKSIKNHLIILLLFTLTVSSQKTIKYGNVPSGKARYDTYITKKGDTISTGQTIKIGLPSSDNGFNHITQGGQKGAVFLSDREVEIYRIRTYKDKRFEKRAYIQFKGYGMLPVDIDYELALKTGEIE